MGRYCGLERWDIESLILITFICMRQGHQLKLDGEGGVRRGVERKVT